MNNITFIKATLIDAESIARLHAISWQRTYRGILPDEFLGEDLLQERLNHWNEKLAKLTSSEFVIMAKQDGALLGFVAVLDKPEMNAEGFIDNLHVHPERKGSGIGKMLMHEAALALEESGRTSAYLWVLQGNDAAEAFYLSRGAEKCDMSSALFGGKLVNQTRFVWRSLAPLLVG